MARRSSGSVAPATAPDPNGQTFARLRQSAKPIGIAQEHFDISQQPVRDQYRFRPLQMRVRGHGRIPGLFGPFQQRRREFC